MIPREAEYRKELETAFEAAEKAGKVIDRYSRNGFDESKKEDGSVVTEADIEAQKAAVSEIKKIFPEDGFLGEEDHLEPEEQERVWVIDPIDGTFNFKKNFGYYCVSIALQVEGETVVGMVYAPETSMRRMFFAVKDEGSYVSNSLDLQEASKLEVSGHETVEDSMFFATMFDIYEDELELEQEIVGKLSRNGATHRQMGSCALEMCYLAAGKVDLVFNPIPKKWDFAAAKLIVEEAGGSVRIQKSRFPDSFELSASNGVLQSRLESILD